MKRTAPKPKKPKNKSNNAQKQKRGKGKPKTLENTAKMLNKLNGKRSVHNNQTLRNRRNRQRKKRNRNKRKRLEKICVFAHSKKKNEQNCCARFRTGSRECTGDWHHARPRAYQTANQNQARNGWHRSPRNTYNRFGLRGKQRQNFWKTIPVTALPEKCSVTSINSGWSVNKDTGN